MSGAPTTPTTPHRKRCKRYNIIGHAHALTFSCFKRQPFLSKDRTRQWFVEAIARAREKHGFHLWAYVIMPEHVHLLIYPPADEYSISAVLTTVKQSVAKRAVLFVRKNAPEFASRMADEQSNGRRVLRFWQRGGGYDRNLDSPKYIWETIDYIHANPVRRGLADSPCGWEWSSARSHDNAATGPLTLDLDSLPDDLR